MRLVGALHSIPVIRYFYNPLLAFISLPIFELTLKTSFNRWITSLVTLLNPRMLPESDGHRSLAPLLQGISKHVLEGLVVIHIRVGFLSWLLVVVL